MAIESSNEQVLFLAAPGKGWVDADKHLLVKRSPFNPPKLEPGQLLLRNKFLSLDPYMRPRMNVEVKSYFAPFELGKVLTGGGISEVVSSEREGIAVGDLVSTFIGWEEYTILPASVPAQVIVNPLGVPLEYFLGILGMPGCTSYHGLLDIGQPKAGDTVFVSGAAGAVGLVVGQLAKLKGCKVVGSAGTDEKVALLVSEFGYDHAFNYKTTTILDGLKKYCPDGIDIYFDNVGGETLDTVLPMMNVKGRLVECGMISQYNETAPYGVKNLMMIVGKQLRMEGFIISESMANRDWMRKFYVEMNEWISQGKIKYAINVVDGLAAAPRAFVGLLKGENTGKQIIKIA